MITNLAISGLICRCQQCDEHSFGWQTEMRSDILRLKLLSNSDYNLFHLCCGFCLLQIDCSFIMFQDECRVSEGRTNGKCGCSHWLFLVWFIMCQDVQSLREGRSNGKCGCSHWLFLGSSFDAKDNLGWLVSKH